MCRFYFEVYCILRFRYAIKGILRAVHRRPRKSLPYLFFSLHNSHRTTFLSLGTLISIYHQYLTHTMRLKLATRWALLLCAAASSLALPAPELTSTKALAVRASTDLAKRALEDYFWVKPGKMDQGGCFDAVGSGDTTTFKDKLDKARDEVRCNHAVDMKDNLH